jgi:hypothetical protein
MGGVEIVHFLKMEMTVCALIASVFVGKKREEMSARTF